MGGTVHYTKVTQSVNLGLCITGAVLNIIALVAMKVAKINTKLPKYLFLISLNLSDILISVSSAVADMLILSDVHWCSITDHMTFLIFTGYAALVSSLVCLGFDLYIALCFPLRYQSIMTSRRATIAIVALWIWSAMVASCHFACQWLSMASSGKDFCNAPSTICTLFLGIYGGYCSLCNCLVFFLHLKVLCTIRRMSSVVTPCLSAAADANAKSTRKSLVTVFLIGITLAIFLLPLYFALLLPQSKYYGLILDICLNWSILNNIADPLIYSFRMSDIRKGYTKMFTCMNRGKIF